MTKSSTSKRVRKFLFRPSESSVKHNPDEANYGRLRLAADSFRPISRWPTSPANPSVRLQITAGSRSLHLLLVAHCLRSSSSTGTQMSTSADGLSALGRVVLSAGAAMRGSSQAVSGLDGTECNIEMFQHEW